MGVALITNPDLLCSISTIPRDTIPSERSGYRRTEAHGEDYHHGCFGPDCIFPGEEYAQDGEGDYREVEGLDRGAC